VRRLLLSTILFVLFLPISCIKAQDPIVNPISITDEIIFWAEMDYWEILGRYNELIEFRNELSEYTPSNPLRANSALDYATDELEQMNNWISLASKEYNLLLIDRAAMKVAQDPFPWLIMAYSHEHQFYASLKQANKHRVNADWYLIIYSSIVSDIVPDIINDLMELEPLE